MCVMFNVTVFIDVLVSFMLHVQTEKKYKKSLFCLVFQPFERTSLGLNFKVSLACGTALLEFF